MSEIKEQEEIKVQAIPCNIANRDTQEALECLTETRAVIIANNADFQNCGESIRAIKTKIAILEQKRMSITRHLDQAKAAAMDLFRPAIDYLKQARLMREGAYFKWQDDQAKLARKAAEDLKCKQIEEARKLKEKADKAAAAGKLEKAEELNNQAQFKESFIPVIPAAPKVNGLASIEVWKARVVNLNELIKYCLETGNQLVIADDKALGGLARSSKGKMNIPGVQFYSERSMSAKTIKDNG
jgi:hypothetical protein